LIELVQLLWTQRGCLFQIPCPIEGRRALDRKELFGEGKGLFLRQETRIIEERKEDKK
jgi:hypothetical protein